VLPGRNHRGLLNGPQRQARLRHHVVEFQFFWIHLGFIDAQGEISNNAVQKNLVMQSANLKN